MTSAWDFCSEEHGLIVGLPSGPGTLSSRDDLNIKLTSSDAATSNADNPYSLSHMPSWQSGCFSKYLTTSSRFC